MLNVKSRVADNGQWLDALASCTDLVSEERTEELTETAVSRIRSVLNGKSACVGWCGGGKDSSVLLSLMERSDVAFTPIFWRGINEYPEMVRWIDKNKPDGLIEKVIGKFTLEFIDANEGFLFCSGGDKYRQRWMAEKWKAQRRDIAGFDYFVCGRRKMDGNNLGGYDENFCKGSTFAPIADWTHEQLLAYIVRNGIELPPFYSWPRGFLVGSVAMGEWTERPVLNLTVDQVWDELFEIDSSIVYGAAEKLRSAASYIEGK